MGEKPPPASESHPETEALPPALQGGHKTVPSSCPLQSTPVRTSPHQSKSVHTSPNQSVPTHTSPYQPAPTRTHPLDPPGPDPDLSPLPFPLSGEAEGFREVPQVLPQPLFLTLPCPPCARGSVRARPHACAPCPGTFPPRCPCPGGVNPGRHNSSCCDGEFRQPYTGRSISGGSAGELGAAAALFHSAS